MLVKAMPVVQTASKTIATYVYVHMCVCGWLWWKELLDSININNCHPNPCLNDGICIDGNSNYMLYISIRLYFTWFSRLINLFRAGGRHFQLVGLCILIVCEAHRHAKHANIRGVWGQAPRKFLKIKPSEIVFLGSFSDLSPIVSATFSYIIIAFIFS